ncbi:MAG TPA: hypothetical protein VE713_16695 [Pyrinomonadaceae bacterium]|nr:hypothetical protein [Pyrinomonadaceae bacterium]
MKLSSLPYTTIKITRGVSRAAVELVALPFSLLGVVFSAEGPSRREELRSDISEIRRLLNTAIAEGMDKDLANVLNFLARHSEAILRAVVVWIDLIDVLVQNAERRYGATPGMGRLKAANVKEVVRYLMRDRKFDIPHVPRFLEPMIIDLLVDWSIDVVVLLANRYGMWEKGAPAPPPSPFRRLRLLLRKGVLLLFAYFLSLYGWIRQALQRPVVIPPEVKAAVEAVEREGLIVSQGELFHAVGDLLMWVSARRRTLMVLVEVVSAAVQEAESFLTLSGPQKKAYARDLVLAALDELGFKERTGLLFAIIDSAIYGSIEASVHLFNKRGLF